MNTILTIQRYIGNLYRSLSPERVILLWVMIILSLGSFFFALVVFNSQFLKIVPTYGGELHEGIVGTPRFINPVLATSEQDKDLTALVYAGITKKDSLGQTVLDMGDTIVESDDNLRYTVTLKSSARFHDGKKVTSDDVIYTIGLLQNPVIKSPYRVKWEGISVQRDSDTQLTFILKRPYPLFMDILTIGILPKHIWKDLTDEQFSLSDYNINAIGSGPYAITDIKSTSGIPNRFVLESHKHYTLGRPYISKIIIDSFSNERLLLQAFTKGDIDRLHGISSEKISELQVGPSNIQSSLLPRTFTVFFNPNTTEALSDKKIRGALEMAINKQAIVDTVLRNYGKVIDTPYAFDGEYNNPSLYNPTEAKELLSGSKFLNASSTLTLTLATANTEEMKKVAEMIQKDWQAIGVETTLAVYEVSDLNQTVIKDRSFQVLLFGSITETPSDLYAFWHSSQRNYPGLNISNYVSNTLDQNLEVLRTEQDPLLRQQAYEGVKAEFREEVPGIFLFAPSLIYITRDTTTTFLPTYSLDNSSRFALVESWYRHKEKVWPNTYYKNITERLHNILK